jgi:hypothetical protein
MQDLMALRGFVDRAQSTMPEDAGVQAEGVIAALDAYLGLLDGRGRDQIETIQKMLVEAPPVDQAAPGLRSALLRILLAACDAAGDAATGLTAADELIALTSSVVWRPEAQRLHAKFLAQQRATNA